MSTLALLIGTAIVTGNGVNNNGAGGRSMALGGATVAGATDPVDALSTNPAALAEIEGSWTLGGFAAYAEGTYKRTGEPTASARSGGVAPTLGMALGGESITLGFAVVPEQARSIDWRYRDADGGLDGRTSYGWREHRADFIGVRSSLGLGAQLNERLRFGASAGLHYANVRLVAPYIFQSQPQLAGVKAALGLDTHGFGASGDLGVVYKVSERLQLGLRYRGKTELSTSGDAVGTAGAQLRSLGISAPGGFRYDAEVETALPRSVSTGFAWQASDRLRVLAASEWVHWSDAFDHLTVRLSNGTNATINSIPGSDDVVDRVPLDYADRFVSRLGLEYAATEKVMLRMGYSYGRSPIPLENITALNAAIAEHTLSAGVGFQLGRTTVDLAYQYDFPNSAKVGRSNIRAGEYSNSTIGMESHWLGVSVSVPF